MPLVARYERVCADRRSLSGALAGALELWAGGQPGRGWSVGRALLSWSGSLISARGGLIALALSWLATGLSSWLLPRLWAVGAPSRTLAHGTAHACRCYRRYLTREARGQRTSSTWFGPWVVSLWCGLARPACLWPPVAACGRLCPPPPRLARLLPLLQQPPSFLFIPTPPSTQTHTPQTNTITRLSFHSFTLLHPHLHLLHPPPLSTFLRRLRTPPSFGRHTRSICLHTSPARTHTHTNTDLTKLKFAQPPANQQ